jgi:anti-sigma factor RsiW
MRGRSMTELTCREVVEFLMDYLAHQLDPIQRQAFDAHLAGCDECVAYIASYERTVRLGKQALELDEPANEQVPDTLIKAILAARRRAT